MSLILEKNIDNAIFAVYDERPSFPLFEVNQVHGDKVTEISDEIVDADGIVCFDSNAKINLAIKTADCLPIVVMGNGMALIHAGWQGVQKKILSSDNVKKLNPSRFYIGPHIGKCCYEVQADFKNNFPQSNAFEIRNDSLFFDLKKEITTQINMLYPDCIVETAQICTCCDDRFFSYRKDKTNKRNWNILST